ncbi:MAG TPA: plasmid maintenance system antidote protein [Bacteroidia bacterium]|nr:plasmid maintenance system antidote protein [Bacteroidia bacterium]
MEDRPLILKGIHPGLVIDRELKKRHIGKSKFAISLQEYPQTFSAITAGKRSMNTKLALKIEKALRLEEGYLMILQTYYNINKLKEKQNKHRPDFKKIRQILFWDTNMEKIDWKKQKRAIIERVFERGNEEEKKEITRFYGKEAIDKIIREKEEASL